MNTKTTAPESTSTFDGVAAAIVALDRLLLSIDHDRALAFFKAYRPEVERLRDAPRGRLHVVSDGFAWFPEGNP